MHIMLGIILFINYMHLDFCFPLYLCVSPFCNIVHTLYNNKYYILYTVFTADGHSILNNKYCTMYIYTYIKYNKDLRGVEKTKSKYKNTMYKYII